MKNYYLETRCMTVSKDRKKHYATNTKEESKYTMWEDRKLHKSPPYKMSTGKTLQSAHHIPQHQLCHYERSMHCVLAGLLHVQVKYPPLPYK